MAKTHTPKECPDKILMQRVCQLEEVNESLELRLAELERMYLRLAQPIAPNDLHPLKPCEWAICREYVVWGNGADAARALGLRRDYAAEVLRRPHCRAWVAQFRRCSEYHLARVSAMEIVFPRERPHARGKRRAAF